MNQKITFGRLLDMGRLFAQAALQSDSDGESETPWPADDVRYADVRSKTVCIISAESERERWQVESQAS